MANPTQIFDEDGQYSLKVNPDGSINVTANIELNESDIQIGAVEIKDATTQERASVSTAHGLKVDVSRIQSGTVTVQDGGGSITVDGTVNIGNTITIAEPVTVDGTVTIQDGGSSITVDGSVSLSSPVAISGVVPISDNGSSITVDGTVNIGNSVAISGPVSISGSVPVTDGGGSLTVDGSVSVSNTVTVADGGGSLTVDGTVTVQDGGGSITIDDGGSSITVDGSVGITGSVAVTDGGSSLTVDGTVNVGNVVPISDNNGSITVDGSVAITNASIPVTDNGGSLTVDGSVSIVGTPTRTQTFTLQNAASALGNGTVADVTGYATGVFAVTITGTATIVLERSQDGSTWYNLETVYSVSSGYPTSSTNVSKVMTASLAGCTNIRARVSAYTNGTVTVSLHASLSEGTRTGGAVLQPSSDSLGGILNAQAVAGFGLAFNGTNWDRLRSVNTGQLKTSLYGATGNALAINADGSLNVNTNADIQIGAVEIKDATTDTRVTVDSTYGMKVDVSRINGTVAVTDNGTTLSVDDGGGSLTVDGTVGISGTVPVSDGGSSISIDDNGGSITVDGTVAISNTSFPVTDNGGSLTVDTTQLPATLTASGNLKVAISEGGISGTVTVQDGGGSLTVDDGGGSLTVDSSQLPTALTAGGNLKVSLSESNATVTVQDGGGSLTVDGSVNITNTTIAVTDNGGSLTVDGTVTIQDGGNTITVDTGQLPAALTAGGYLKVSVQENTTNQTVTIQDGGNVISVDDAGSSLTIDSPQLPSTLTGSGNLKVALAESTTGVTVTDGGGSLTVDGSVSVSGTVTATSAAAQMQTFTLQSSAGAVGNGTAADITGFDVFVIQTTITGTATITFEQSSDNTSWHTAVGQLVTTAGALVSTATASNVYKFSVSGMKYFRARISSWTSGTVSATGYATTGEQVFVPITSQYGSSDSNSTGHYLQGVGAYNLIFNGSIWVRPRTADSIFDANAGGLIPATALWAFNGTTFDRLKTVNTGQLRTSLYGTTGNALAVNADGSLNVNTNADIQIGAVEIKDGTTDTRAVVDATYGLKVDVSRLSGTVNVADGGGSITVDGTVSVTDGGGTLTVDSTQLPTALTASGNLKVALVEDSTVISVDDNGSSLTVDSTQLPTTLTGSGNLKVALSESSASVTVADGGGSITTDTSQLPAALTGSGNLKVSLSESVTTVNIADGGGSITVDGTVTVGNASIPVTDNGSSLTVDSTQLPAALTAGGNLKVAIQEGGFSGSVSNASDSVATSSTNIGAVSYLYGFDGTTWDRLKVDTSGNLQVTAGPSVVGTDFTFQNAAGAVGNGSVATVTGYSVATLRVVISATATVSFEASNDNTNFDPIAGLTPFVSAFSNTVTSSNTYQINVAGFRYLRARVSSWTSGTVTVIGTFGQGIPRAPHGLIVTSIADGLSGSNTAQLVQSANGVYNGTTWDRVRSSSADALAATGVQAAGNMFFNGSTWDRGRTATADALAATGIQAKGTMLYNGATWDRARTATADGLAATGLQAGAMLGFNGTTWDRLRVDANKNLNVNLNASNATITVADGGGSLTVDGTVSISNASIPVTDNGSSLTVDSTQLPTALSAGGNLKVDVQNYPATQAVSGTVTVGNSSIPVTDNGGSLTVDDGGSSLTVDGTVAISNASFPVTDNGGSLTIDSAQLPTSLSASGNLKVAIVEGGFSGSVSNASDAVATSSTNLGAVSYMYGFDGTSWDRLKVDANGNLLSSLGSVKPSSLFTFQNAAGAIGDGTVANVSEYATATLLFSTTGTATTIAEVSNNNSTWTTIAGFSPNLTLDSFAVSFTSGHFQFNVSGYKYFRARVSSWTSGTVTVTGYFTQGTVRTPHGKMTTAFGDGVSNGTTAQAVSSYGAVFNGSGWDRARTASGDALAATGLQAVGLMGYNGAQWDRLRVDANDNLKTVQEFAQTTQYFLAGVTVAGAGTSYSALGFASLKVSFTLSGTATVQMEGSLGGGWFPLRGYNLSTFENVVSVTSGQIVVYDISNLQDIRANVTAYTNGNVNALAYYSKMPNGLNPSGNSSDTRSDAVAGTSPVQGFGYNGATWDRLRVNNKHVYQEYLLLTNGQHLDIWTPVSGKKFRLMAVMIGSRTAAELIVRDATNSTTFSNIATFNLGGRDTLTFDFRNGYLSSAVNNKVAVYNQTGSTVALWATFIGTEE